MIVATKMSIAKKKVIYKITDKDYYALMDFIREIKQIWKKFVDNADNNRTNDYKVIYFPRRGLQE
ncbi:hypothetical protein [Saccharolobus caldissimus]|uniref:Uncharacterized protein n=1 Tax=Saccharolobus caldissimus TaxID=1702097 RepID=A0AAQ4CR20_9CREN|nr:hypothetical protein [Saccharolobus caldissimus]BDB98251.1 hypothetical protein SACC_12680 [Saccharolobus caldissimus]